MKSSLCNMPVILTLLILSYSPGLQAQSPRITEWVEEAPSSDYTKIALGYPVPISVDTPLPFDGFRSYKGLHMRHQDLALTTPWVHPVELGTSYRGRRIWLYQLGDADRQTATGLPEHAMLGNAGIHAREWQSPEVATGIIELLALAPDDHHLLSYLRENTNILIIPVLNIDGFLQTQRFPDQSWMGTDPDNPDYAPRDGRMRRKNMRGPDEELITQNDHLLGVDLNRNNPPFWASNPNRSSSNRNSIVHHGAARHSEPETQALDAAAQLGPIGKLSMYTDIHSFSQVHFWVRNSNQRLTRLTEKLLQTFSDHHRSFPAGKNYTFSRSNNVALNSGIGATDEFFTHSYQVPSWTLEIEPSDGGIDYGGFGRNGHDGFILPESEIERVRTELAQTFMLAYYQQAGPPSIAALRLTDKDSGAVVFEAEWDTMDAASRSLHIFQAQPLQLDRDYRAWIAWDKPMRWRTDGEVSPLPGNSGLTLKVARKVTVNGSELVAAMSDPRWLDRPGDAPGGYLRYRDDALDFDLRFPSDTTNQDLVRGTVTAALETNVFDMTGTRGDADPSTVARWENGAWSGYEDSEGNDQNDSGGTDSSIHFELTSEQLESPFVVETASSAMWYDTSRNGEGFMLEIISGARAIMYWFTYDLEGKQDWYFGDGEIRGNRILFPDLLRVSGGEFGPGFDPGKVVRTPVGSASFIWSSCDSGSMKWVIDRDGGSRRQGRMDVSRLTRVMGIPCTDRIQPPILEAARLSGSWYDPSHSGEGYALEVLSNQQVLVTWFSFDMQGKRRWFFGTGEIAGSKLVFDEMFTTLGGVFGPGFDPEAVELNPWGRLELELDCEHGTARFDPVEEDFPAGTLNLARLTVLDGFSCDS